MHSFISPSVFNPKSIPNLYAWYKFDSLLLSGTSPTFTVSAAYDKSGNGRHAVQATAGSQPIYSASNGQNNLPYWINTDAVSGGRYLLAGATTDWTFLHDGTGFTVFIVMKAHSTQQNYFFGTQTGTGASLGLTFVRINNTTAQISMGNIALHIVATNFSQPMTSWTKLAVSGSTGGDPDYSVRITGSYTATANELASPSSNTSTQKLGIGSGGGGAYSLSSSFHEVIIYNRELNITEVKNVEQYLKMQYGL